MASNPPGVLRLTFAYRGARIALAASERVAMIAPAPNTQVPQPGQTGYWFAVLDRDGRVLYHRPLHRPIAVDREAFSPDGKQSITRVPIPEREGRFTVLIPDVDGADRFTLHGPPDPERPDEPSRELLALDVDALRATRPVPGAGKKP